MKNYFLALALFFVTALQVAAQDNNAVKVNDKIPVTGSEKTDFIFTRSLLIGSVDSVPFDQSRSGSYSIGIGYGFPIGRVVEIKIEPRATWHKIYFQQSRDRWFPSSGVNQEVVYEKMRAFYVEMPVGLKFKMARNVDDKYKILLEGGFSFGLNLGSTSKTRLKTDLDGDGTNESRTTVKVNKVPELNQLRYGPYVRLGTNWISFYGFYRMTEIFDPAAKFGDQPDLNISGRDYPKFPSIELGVSITI